MGVIFPQLMGAIFQYVCAFVRTRRCLGCISCQTLWMNVHDGLWLLLLKGTLPIENDNALTYLWQLCFVFFFLRPRQTAFSMSLHTRTRLWLSQFSQTFNVFNSVSGQMHLSVGTINIYFWVILPNAPLTDCTQVTTYVELKHDVNKIPIRRGLKHIQDV